MDIQPKYCCSNHYARTILMSARISSEFELIMIAYLGTNFGLAVYPVVQMQPGVGPTTRKRLIEHFGSVRGIKAAGPDALTAVVNAKTAQKIREYFLAEREAAIDGTGTATSNSGSLRILQ